jgi:hypothetical protein
MRLLQRPVPRVAESRRKTLGLSMASACNKARWNLKSMQEKQSLIPDKESDILLNIKKKSPTP